MSQIERVYKIDKLLKAKRPPSMQLLKEKLEVSEATIKRDIEIMRDRLGAPLVWLASVRGYQYDPSAPEFTLPGLWFTAHELRALLVITSLIDQIQPGYLRDRIAPFQKRLRELAEQSAGNPAVFEKRIAYIPAPIRTTNSDHLESIVHGTFARRRIEIDYESRGRGERRKRVISPIRLIYYRNHWYLDAFCHFADEGRRFAVDAVYGVRVLNERAHEVRSKKRERTGYGIFAGTPIDTAILKFSEKAGRWIKNSQWHPDQTLSLLPDGGVLLEVPYSSPQEILMEILRHGADVEVLKPVSLRDLVVEALNRASGLYTHSRRVVGRETITPRRRRLAG